MRLSPGPNGLGTREPALRELDPRGPSATASPTARGLAPKFSRPPADASTAQRYEPLTRPLRRRALSIAVVRSAMLLMIWSAPRPVSGVVEYPPRTRIDGMPAARAASASAALSPTI